MRATGSWMSSQRDEYSGSSSGGYDGYGADREDADAGVWDEDTAELSAPEDSRPRFVNMRARATVMPGMSGQWGRERPGTEAHRYGPHPRGIQRWFHRGPNGELKLPPAWVMLNLLILLVVGVIAAPHVFAAETNSCGWYTVQSGDTIPSLAERYHATAKSIVAANHLAASQKLTAGQRLCIPSQAVSDSILAPAVRPPGATATPKPKPTPTPTPAKPAPAPKTGSVSGAKAFIQFVLPYAKRAHADTGWPTSMIIAQWGVEHGWKLPSFTGYNFGNVASVPGEPTVPGTAAKGSPSRFSYAKTPEDGLRQYLKVAHLSYYAPVTAASKSGANAAALALGKSPWDAGHYGGAGNPGSTLLGVMKSFNLYAYDK
jgi:LysM repeat protein